MNAVKDYRPKGQDHVKAAKVTTTNIDELAVWCGGSVIRQPGDDERDDYLGLNVPSMEGPFRVSAGEYLIRDIRGRFTKEDAGEFEANFDELGKRQDGIAPFGGRRSL